MSEIEIRPAKKTAAKRQKEGTLSDAIRAALAHEPGLILWRNSVGVLKSRGRFYRTGLVPGSADLVGTLALEVSILAAPVETPARVNVGRFVGLEVKRPGEELDPLQIKWSREVRAAGGFVAVVRSPEEARAAIARARRGAVE